MELLTWKVEIENLKGVANKKPDGSMIKLKCFGVPVVYCIKSVGGLFFELA